MALLYYWRGDNYRRDLDHGVGFHLNQASPVLHTIDIGDSLWAFTRAADGRYVLAAELVVSARTRNPAGYRYGPYRVWGDLGRSRYFSSAAQPDITPVIRGLSIRAGGQVLGHAFQGHSAVRRLAAEDHRFLAAYALGLPAEPRARLLPEEQLEATLISGNAHLVSRLLGTEESGIGEERRRYLAEGAVRRNRDLVLQLRDTYDGACQICGWCPRTRYGQDVCEGHHLRWLSRGGDDTLSNLALLCPNHHRAIHRCDAPFDFASMAFLFGCHAEPLASLRHELSEATP